MTEMQSKLMDMLIFFHALCEKNEIRYYLVGGTALGAVRHQGFIPWDDDIDVGVPRKDYERLKQLSSQINEGKYFFEFPSEAKDFVYTYGKLYDVSTTLIENTRYKTKRGIYIDIFPLDGAGNTYEESLMNFKTIDKKINLLSTKTCAWRKGRKLYKNLALLAMRCVPEFVLSTKKLKADIDKMCKERVFDEFDYVANFCGNWHEKEIMKRGWFGTPQKLSFEGVDVFCPEHVDEYLSALYGDWRKLPPKEKQQSHHDYIEVNLQKSYLN